MIKDGVLVNRDLKMLAPLIYLQGSGLVPLPQRAVDYTVTAKLVATLKGQGRKDVLAGLPIPINVKGPWDHVSYKVEWKRVFDDIAADPERLKHLSQKLRDASQGFGINLPVPQLSGQGEGASPLDLLLQLKKKFPKAPPVSTTTKEPEEKKELSIPDASKILKGLFKR